MSGSYIDQYIGYIKKHVTQKPDVVADAERFSSLHSWFKHLSKTGTTFFVFLARGEQPRYDFSRSFSKDDQSKFHWHFARLDSCDTMPFPLDDNRELSGFPREVIMAFSRFTVSLRNTFGGNDGSIDAIRQVTDNWWRHFMSESTVSDRATPIKMDIRKATGRARKTIDDFEPRVRMAFANAVTLKGTLSEIKHIETANITKIMHRYKDFYCDLGIIEEVPVNAFDRGLADGTIGIDDVVKAFYTNGLVADEGRNLVRKCIGDEANNYLYLSPWDMTQTDTARLD